jgi:hypothetical protein
MINDVEKKVSCRLCRGIKMGDDELAAIRNRRMAELQAQMVNAGVFASSFLCTNTCPDIFPEVTFCAPNHSRRLIDKILD